MLIQVEQGTEEWFEIRKGRLTASVAASAAGLEGSYTSRPACWKEYMGAETVVTDGLTWAMEYGNEYEEVARDAGERAMDALSYPVGVHVSDDYDWLCSSTDGVFHKMGLHEIKCRPTQPYEEISPQHMAQIQVQLECAGCGRCYFQSWTPDQQRIWLVQRSRDYFEWLLPHLEEFWGYVCRKEQPPRLGKRRRYPQDIPHNVIYEGDSHGI